MTKIKETTIFMGLLLLSFFITNSWVNILKDNDPLMQEIKAQNDNYTKSSISAKIVGDKMISGLTGLEIDLDKTYHKMKRYGNYNESLIEMKKVKPTISIDNHYDKYIVRGNPQKRSISLVFVVSKEDNLEELLKILEVKKTTGTFFIDGTLLEKYHHTIKKYPNHEYEVLSYNNEYSESMYKSSISYLESITKKKVGYCYNDQGNNELLNLCQKLKLHSIQPSFYSEKNIYHDIKTNLNNSLIFAMPINKIIIKELSLSIDYIKKKGYKLEKISSLLSETP